MGDEARILTARCYNWITEGHNKLEFSSLEIPLGKWAGIGSVRGSTCDQDTFFSSRQTPLGEFIRKKAFTRRRWTLDISLLLLYRDQYAFPMSWCPQRSCFPH